MFEWVTHTEELKRLKAIMKELRSELANARTERDEAVEALKKNTKIIEQISDDVGKLSDKISQIRAVMPEDSKKRLKENKEVVSEGDN